MLIFVDLETKLARKSKDDENVALVCGLKLHRHFRARKVFGSFDKRTASIVRLLGMIRGADEF